MNESNILLVIPRREGERERDVYYREIEIRSLLETLGLRISYEKSFTLKERHGFGKGQLEEIKELCITYDITEVVVDDFISPREEMKMEGVINLPVSDREALILAIFKTNAHSMEAKLQTRKAELVYLKPRLVSREADYSQQRGGVRGAKGEGEKERELKRRNIEKEILTIDRALSDIKKRRTIQYHRREKNNIYSFALAGYTNSGKTTLLNALSENTKAGEDKLFATLDTTTRVVTLPSKRKVLLSDTVGFIQNLPPSLIDAFSSTLSGAASADSIIIVADSSHPDAVKCFNTTLETLKNLGLDDKISLVVINKIDENRDDIALSYLESSPYRTVKTSFKEKRGIEDLISAMDEISGSSFITITLTLTPESPLLSSLSRDGTIKDVKYTDDGKMIVKAEIHKSLRVKYQEEEDPVTESPRNN